jgi:tetrapyrrole methylase family protein / MazG family protein
MAKRKSKSPSAQLELRRLYAIMKRLRAPGGCPWDREQTHASLLKCLIEECYEFHEAVMDGDPAKMCEELGDIMLQVVFHSVIARETGAFDLKNVLKTISDKLVRRHPHVFGKVKVKDSDEVVTNWEKIKRGEKSAMHRESILDGIPNAMPAMLRALKVQKRAAKAGFDWKKAGPIIDKIHEETDELKAEIRKNDPERLTHELGDMLFSVVNLARHLHVDPEEALQRTNRKFIHRFRGMEKKIRSQGLRLQDLSLKKLDRFWEAEKNTGSRRGNPSVKP